jgi:thiamine pyrophosphate-dependent acetolactate synthase large subunit-like protein
MPSQEPQVARSIVAGPEPAVGEAGPTAATAIVAALEEAGIDTVFGLPGVHNLSLFDALERSRIRPVVTRHEATASHAADGYARARGGPGVVLTTTGPGAANALTGIGEAWAAGSAVLHLTTQVGVEAVESGVQRGILHQSPGQMDFFRPVTRFAERVRSASEAGRTVSRALAATRTGRSRPAYVEVPFDLLDGPGAWAPATAPPGPAAPEPARVEEAADILERADRVAIWAGGGVIAAGAWEILRAVARRLAAPVVTTFMGRGAVADDDPLSVGLPPHEPEVGRFLSSCDALLAVGTEFAATMTMNAHLQLPERIVHLDVDPEEIGKSYPALGVIGDAGVGLAALDEVLASRAVDRAGQIDTVAEDVARIRRTVWDDLSTDPSTAPAVAFLQGLRAAAPPEAVIVVDMCIAGYWCGGYLPIRVPRTLLYPVGWGTLGFGFPASIGAAFAGSGPVVAVVGDGGFMYGAGDLATIREHSLDLVVLVVNDGGYGMLRYGEVLSYGRTFAADLFTPDFGRLAAAFDIPYILATLEREGDGGLRSAISRAIRAGGPHVIELRAELTPPRTTGPRWPKHP